MSEPVVLYSAEAGVATITLNRPSVLNALDTELMNTLRDLVSRVGSDDSIRAVIVTGNGRGFSAGADLSATFPSGERPAPGVTLRERYHPVVLGMREMPKPIICAVNGVAAGAGMSIALAGDIVLAAKSASFLQAFSKIGLVPDAGSTWFLPRYAGDQRARALAILADKIDAEDAMRFGLVWKVYPDETLMSEARALAARLAAMPTRAYALIKRALSASQGHSLAEQLELEADLQNQAASTEDFREGVAAFVAKRPPVFRGR